MPLCSKKPTSNYAKSVRHSKAAITTDSQKDSPPTLTPALREYCPTNRHTRAIEQHFSFPRYRRRRRNRISASPKKTVGPMRNVMPPQKEKILPIEPRCDRGATRAMCDRYRELKKKRDLLTERRTKYVSARRLRCWRIGTTPENSTRKFCGLQKVLRTGRFIVRTNTGI